MGDEEGKSGDSWGGRDWREQSVTEGRRGVTTQGVGCRRKKDRGRDTGCCVCCGFLIKSSGQQSRCEVLTKTED